MSIQYKYDELNRLVGVVYENGSEVTYAYDHAGNLVAINVRGEIAPRPAVPVVASAPASRPAPDIAPTPIWQPPVAAAQSIPQSPEGPTMIKADSPTWELILQMGPDSKTQTIPLGDQVTIGREADNDICLKDPEVSRHHAIIQRQGEVYHIVDKGSSNGTFLNGARLTGTAALNNGDTITIGKSKIGIRERV